MPLINLTKILTSDQVGEAFDKINFNFEQIALAGGGPVGKTGNLGKTGGPGGPGKKGDKGADGEKGADWFITNADPISLTSQSPATANETMWLNTSSGNIYKWDGTQWVLKGTFGSVNYWTKVGDNIANANSNDSIVLSDQSSSNGTIPAISNDNNFLLKLNSVSGSHLIFTNGDNKDNEGVTVRLTNSDFYIDSVSNIIDFTISSQKGLILLSSQKMFLNSQDEIELDAVKKMYLHSNLEVEISSDNVLRLNSGVNDTRIKSKVAIGASEFLAEEQLQVGNEANPGNIMATRGNGTVGGNVILKRNTFKGTLDTDTLINNVSWKFPIHSGKVGILREFNGFSETEDFVKIERSYAFGKTQDSPGSYSQKGTMSRDASTLFQVGSISALDGSGAEAGGNYHITYYYKIVGNIVLFKWLLTIEAQHRSGNDTEQVFGINIPIPYDGTRLSMQAASPIQTKTLGFSNFTSRMTHVGSLISKTDANPIVEDITFQVIPIRDGSNTFTGSRIVILKAFPLQFKTGNYYQLSGEATLDMVATVASDTASVNVMDLGVYLSTTNLNATNPDVPKRASVFYAPIDGFTKFDGSGIGISGDVIGWCVCNGQNSSPDLRGRFVVGVDPSDIEIDTVGKIGGRKEVALTVSNLAPHTHIVRITSGDDGDGASFDDAVPASPGQTKNFTTDSTGNGTPHENRPPFYAGIWIMKL